MRRTSNVRQRLDPPIEFGKFLLTEQIGEGGMAQAFRATTSWAEGVAKEVCVKRILSPLASDERMRAMFIQEARIAASLTHANVVPVYEFGVVDEYYFLAMEYVDGYTLRDINMQCARVKRWPGVAVVLHVISEALEGLDYAHRKRDADGLPLQIVHQDVTPGNVMASVEGEVKILDFGIALMASGAVPDPSAAGPAAEAPRGKPGYMSPEQAVGMAVDRRSDIYSVGVLLYELLTHRRLFRDKTVAERLRRATQIAPPSQLNSELGPELDPIMLKALNPTPAERHGTAAAFRDALLDYLHGRGLRAGRSHVARQLTDLFGGGSIDGQGQAHRMGSIGEVGQLARPPRQGRRARSERRISTSVGQVSLHSTLRRARRVRRRGLLFGLLLLVAAGVAAGVLLAMRGVV